MTLIVILSVLFLLSPILGYVLISVDLPLKTKLIAGAILAFLLTVAPLVVLIVAGG